MSLSPPVVQSDIMHTLEDKGFILHPLNKGWATDQRKNFTIKTVLVTGNKFF
jgi:hypothetical protein